MYCISITNKKLLCTVEQAKKKKTKENDNLYRQKKTCFLFHLHRCACLAEVKLHTKSMRKKKTAQKLFEESHPGRTDSLTSSFAYLVVTE